MPGNIGIAAAQNYGINYAVEHNYNYLSIWIKIVSFLKILSVNYCLNIVFTLKFHYCWCCWTTGF